MEMFFSCFFSNGFTAFSAHISVQNCIMLNYDCAKEFPFRRKVCVLTLLIADSSNAVTQIGKLEYWLSCATESILGLNACTIFNRFGLTGIVKPGEE